MHLLTTTEPKQKKEVSDVHAQLALQLQLLQATRTQYFPGCESGAAASQAGCFTESIADL